MYRDGKRTVFVLEKMRNGRRYTIKLEARNEEEADRELAAFERDPVRFRVVLPATAGALAVETATIQAVLDWQKSEAQSKDHRYATRLYLKAWAHALQGRDLNTIGVVECERLLDGWRTARKLRIVALKTFCTYHVKRGLLANNPAARLEVPAALAAKHKGESRDYTKAEVERAYAATDTQVQRDTIRLALFSGLHITEIERFAGGVGRLVKVEGQGEIGGVLWVLQKSQEMHPNSIDAATFAAAERVRARGRIPGKSKRWEFAVRVAQKLSRELEQEIEPVQYGSLRHSFITWSRSQGGRMVKPKDYGVSLEEIREVVGHRSTRTTRGYDGTEIPPMIAVPLNLRHPSDPKVVESVEATRSRARRTRAGRGGRR